MRGDVERVHGAQHLAEGVAGNEGDQEVRHRWRKERPECTFLKADLDFLFSVLNTS